MAEPNNTPLINGRAYDFAQISVNVLGVPLMGVQSINYSQEQVKSNNFGAGKWAVSRGRGKIEPTCEIELSMNDVVLLRSAIPTGSLLDIPPFPIVVTYLNNQRPVVDVIHNCEFTIDGREGSLDDTDLTFTFQLVPSHISFG